MFDALSQLIQASGLTVVLATHNMDIAARMDRRVTIRDGLIVELDVIGGAIRSRILRFCLDCRRCDEYRRS